MNTLPVEHVSLQPFADAQQQQRGSSRMSKSSKFINNNKIINSRLLPVTRPKNLSNLQTINELRERIPSLHTLQHASLVGSDSLSNSAAGSLHAIHPIQYGAYVSQDKLVPHNRNFTVNASTEWLAEEMSDLLPAPELDYIRYGIAYRTPETPPDHHLLTTHGSIDSLSNDENEHNHPHTSIHQFGTSATFNTTRKYFVPDLTIVQHTNDFDRMVSTSTKSSSTRR